jgi:flagellar basal body-associated protein FliL
MSRKDEQFFKKGNKLLISIVATTVLIVGITTATTIFANEVVLKDTHKTRQQTTEKETVEQITEAENTDEA